MLNIHVTLYYFTIPSTTCARDRTQSPYRIVCFWVRCELWEFSHLTASVVSCCIRSKPSAVFVCQSAIVFLINLAHNAAMLVLPFMHQSHFCSSCKQYCLLQLTRRNIELADVLTNTIPLLRKMCLLLN